MKNRPLWYIRTILRDISGIKNNPTGKGTRNSATGFPRKALFQPFGQLIPLSEVVILLTVHLSVRTGCLILLSAQMEQTERHNTAHFGQLRGAVFACIVRNGIHIDENIARHDPGALAVAVIERDDIRMVVVAELLPVDSDVILR